MSKLNDHLFLSRPTKQKYGYQRPAFLKLATEDEIQVSWFQRSQLTVISLLD